MWCISKNAELNEIKFHMHQQAIMVHICSLLLRPTHAYWQEETNKRPRTQAHCLFIIRVHKTHHATSLGIRFILWEPRLSHYQGFFFKSTGNISRPLEPSGRRMDQTLEAWLGAARVREHSDVAESSEIWKNCIQEEGSILHRRVTRARNSTSNKEVCFFKLPH